MAKLKCQQEKQPKKSSWTTVRSCYWNVNNRHLCNYLPLSLYLFISASVTTPRDKCTVVTHLELFLHLHSNEPKSNLKQAWGMNPGCRVHYEAEVLPDVSSSVRPWQQHPDVSYILASVHLKSARVTFMLLQKNFQSEPSRNLTMSRTCWDFQYKLIKYPGHYIEVFVSLRSQELFLPRVAAWLSLEKIWSVV